MHKAQAPLDVLTTLRDHRPHTCNIDDWLRMVSLPKQPGVCFRDLQGVVTNPDSESLGSVGVCSCEGMEGDGSVCAPLALLGVL